MAEVPGNKCLWYILFFLNTLFSIAGFALMIISFILFFKAKEVFTIGVMVTAIGIVTLFSSAILLVYGQKSSGLICSIQVLQIILAGFFVFFSAYLTIDHNGMLEFLIKNVQTDKNSFESLKSLVHTNLEIIEFTSYGVVVAMVLGIISSHFYRKSLNENDKEHKKQVKHGDPITRKLSDSLI
mmetsp:Transcript_36930/g.38292  ORF Transcript_36930/g.38292 Transcript_36930/m.38292 type:complete len:183 (+) Transcript_36930:37-585(+)